MGQDYVKGHLIDQDYVMGQDCSARDVRRATTVNKGRLMSKEYVKGRLIRQDRHLCPGHSLLQDSDLPAAEIIKEIYKLTMNNTSTGTIVNISQSVRWRTWQSTDQLV